MLTTELVDYGDALNARITTATDYKPRTGATVLFRGAVVNRIYGTHKKLYISLFLLL